MENGVKCFEMWWPGTELNRRRQPFQGCALPPELPGHVSRAAVRGLQGLSASARFGAGRTTEARRKVCGTPLIIATASLSLNVQWQYIGIFCAEFSAVPANPPRPPR